MAKLNQVEVDDIVSAARSFVNSKAYDMIFAKLQDHYISVLKSSNIGDLKASSAHASLRTLDDLKAQIELFSRNQGVL